MKKTETAEYQRTRMDQRRARGDCVRCGKRLPREDSCPVCHRHIGLQCEPCAAYHRAAVKKYEMKKRGL